MLKYVLAFFAFIVVSLAPVYADEGYIPFFPDFLEPDGIGFRGPAESTYKACWSQINVKETCPDDISREEKGIYSRGKTAVRSSPITFEYRKNYFFKKLFYFENFLDINLTATDATIVRDQNTSLKNSDVDSNTFLSEFLTEEEKSILSRLDDSNYLNLETTSNTLLFGTSIGLDLWILEWSVGPFLMYHDTLVNLRSCKGNLRISGKVSTRYKPSSCQLYPDEISNLDEKRFTGFAVGHRREVRIVFLQTDNWRISMSGYDTEIVEIWDSNFKPLKYRSLNYGLGYETQNYHDCKPHQIVEYDQSTSQTTYRDGDCINSKGQDMSQNADWTGNFQITYYFR